jgi:hypothetical protein
MVFHFEILASYDPDTDEKGFKLVEMPGTAPLAARDVHLIHEVLNFILQVRTRPYQHETEE